MEFLLFFRNGNLYLKWSEDWLGCEVYVILCVIGVNYSSLFIIEFWNMFLFGEWFLIVNK